MPAVVPHTAVDRSASPQRVPFGLVTGSYTSAAAGKYGTANSYIDKSNAQIRTSNKQLDAEDKQIKAINAASDAINKANDTFSDTLDATSSTCGS